MIWRIACALAGLSCVGTEVFGVYDQLLSEQGRLNYLVVAGCLVAALAPACPALGRWLARAGRPLSAGAAYAVFVMCITIVSVAAITRGGTAIDGAEAARSSIASQAKALAISEADARAALEATSAARSAECKSGRGENCRDLEAAERDAREAVARAVERQGVSTPNQRDPLASRIAAIFPVSEVTFRTYWPLALPLTLFGLGTLLLTAATAPLPRAVVIPSEVIEPVAKFLIDNVRPSANGAIPLREFETRYRDRCREIGSPQLPTSELASELLRLFNRAGVQVARTDDGVSCFGIEWAA